MTCFPAAHLTELISSIHKELKLIKITQSIVSQLNRQLSKEVQMNMSIMGKCQYPRPLEKGKPNSTELGMVVCGCGPSIGEERRRKGRSSSLKQ